MTRWEPATIEAVNAILQRDLNECDAEATAKFRQFAVDPYFAPILRYGNLERVVVVARRGSEVIYWEDIEEGFNVSPVSGDGRILEHWCNQDELRHALSYWIDGRDRQTKVGPSTSFE